MGNRYGLKGGDRQEAVAIFIDFATLLVILFYRFTGIFRFYHFTPFYAHPVLPFLRFFAHP